MTTSTVQPGMRAVMASPYTPIAVINGTPIYPLQGGRSGGGIRIAVGDDSGSDDDILDDAEDDDEDDDRDEDDEDEQDGDDEDEDERPAARKRTGRKADADDAMARMEAALRKANQTAAKNRRAGKVMERLGIEDLPTWLTERGIDPETGSPFGNDVVDPDDDGQDDDPLDQYETRGRDDSRKRDRELARDIRAAEKRAEARVRSEVMPILAQTAAVNALREAGFNGSKAQMERALRMIDPEELDFSLEDGYFDIEGLDEAVAAIRDDFPTMFEDREKPRRNNARADGTGTRRTAPARRASGARDVDGGDRGKVKRTPGGWLDQVAKAMERQGR